MRVVIGADSDGMELKEWLKDKLVQEGFEVEDKKYPTSRRFYCIYISYHNRFKRTPGKSRDCY